MYGYIPDIEKRDTIINITNINDGEKTSNLNMYWYKYKLQLNINGTTRISEIFSKPLPIKYHV
jgi:hypothetical protein